LALQRKRHGNLQSIQRSQPQIKSISFDQALGCGEFGVSQGENFELQRDDVLAELPKKTLASSRLMNSVRTLIAKTEGSSTTAKREIRILLSATRTIRSTAGVPTSGWQNSASALESK